MDQLCQEADHVRDHTEKILILRQVPVTGFPQKVERVDMAGDSV